MSLGTRLGELRIKKKESLQQVADAVGVSKAHIWELEKGKTTNPGLELLTKLAQHFKVGIAWLAGEDEISDPAAMQFFREFEGKLGEDDWEALRALAARFSRGKD